MDWEDLFLKGLLGLSIVLTVGLFLGLGLAIYYEIHAEKFYLRKDQFACSKAHTELITAFVPAGKIMIPVMQSHVVCDQYTRGVK